MSKWEIFYKYGATSVGGFVGYFFGGWSPILGILLTFVILDYVSGMAAGFVEGKLSSRIGFKAIPKKVMIFVIVGVAHLIDQALGDGSTHLFRDAAIFFYLSNELLSIIENSGRIGLPVPEPMQQAVSVLKGKSEATKAEEVQDIEDEKY